jgi:hypothetical protein
MTKQKDKQCRDCAQYFPDTEDHFKKRRDGSLDTRCLICRRRVMQGRKKKERAATLHDIEQGAINEFLKSQNRGGENIPHSSEVLERLMEYFGGVSGFSGLLMKQYFDSPPGGSTRTKMLEAMLRLVVKNTEMGGAKKPMEQWTDEELEAELDARLARVAQQFQGRIINATVTKEAAPALPAPQRGQDWELREVPAERDSGRASKQKDRGPKAVPADPDSGRDAQMPSE